MIAVQAGQCAVCLGSNASQQLVGRTTTGQMLVICEISKDTQFRLPKDMTFVDACETSVKPWKTKEHKLCIISSNDIQLKVRWGK